MKKPGDYYALRLWPICRPAAMRAHDAAMGTGGVGHEATPPFVMRTLYGSSRAKVVSALRHPVDRLETSFWAHSHYPKKYGASAAGLHEYIAEQTKAYDECSATHGSRRCAYLFELLEQKYGDVFFHCDQIIRGVCAATHDQPDPFFRVPRAVPPPHPSNHHRSSCCRLISGTSPSCASGTRRWAAQGCSSCGSRTSSTARQRRAASCSPSSASPARWTRPRCPLPMVRTRAFTRARCAPPRRRSDAARDARAC